MSKILLIIIIVVTAITTSAVTLKLSNKQPEKTDIEQNIIPNSLLNSPMPTSTPIPKPIVQTPRPQIEVPAATPVQQVQDVTLKIEQCKVQAQILAKQAAQEWFGEMILRVPALCQNSYESDCSLKWTESFADTANKIEQTQYYPAAYSGCLNSIQ
jgi:hypothetical protein